MIFRCFDADGCQASGIRGDLIDAIILTIILVSVVVIIPAIGTILSIALVAAPAAGLKRLVNTPTGLLIAAPIAGVT
ncbi:metal ABC transporter permease, partial [Klebsiella pneumoniae]